MAGDCMSCVGLTCAYRLRPEDGSDWYVRGRGGCRCRSLEGGYPMTTTPPPIPTTPTIEYDNALHMMELQGGSFVRALVDCYYAADNVNKLKLRETFAHYFDDYRLRYTQYRAAKDTAAQLAVGE